LEPEHVSAEGRVERDVDVAVDREGEVRNGIRELDVGLFKSI
jgi:hypothetical protein